MFFLSLPLWTISVVTRGVCVRGTDAAVHFSPSRPTTTKQKHLISASKRRQAPAPTHKQASLSARATQTRGMFASSQLGSSLNVLLSDPPPKPSPPTGCQNSESRCARFKGVNRSGVGHGGVGGGGGEKNTSKSVWDFKFVGRLERAPACEKILCPARAQNARGFPQR